MLGVLGTDGLFRVSRSGDRIVAGDPESYAALVPAEEQSDALVAPSVDRWDGVARYTGRLRLYDYPLAVVVGLSEREQLAAVGHAARMYVMRTTVGSVLLILLMTLLGRMSWQLARSRARASAAETQHAQRVEHLAYHDSLTALPNRSLFNKLLAQAIRRARRYQGRLAVAFIDLDRFKQINDTLGHEAGDQLLCEVAERLRTVCATATSWPAWAAMSSWCCSPAAPRNRTSPPRRPRSLPRSASRSHCGVRSCV